MITPIQIRLFELVESLSTARAPRSERLFLVGGIVRDLLLGEHREEHDIDLIVEGDAPRFAEEVAAAIGGRVRSFPRFLTAKIEAPTRFPEVHELDFASARTERYPAPGSLPVVRAARIEDDLRRRDFSINALALPLRAGIEWARRGDGDLAALRNVLLDQFGGLGDLDARRIRILHVLSFRDDPTRIFRACRYAARIGGTLAEGTDSAASAAVAAGALATISAGRKRNELQKILLESGASKALRCLAKFGVWHVFPLFREELLEDLCAALDRNARALDSDRVDTGGAAASEQTVLAAAFGEMFRRADPQLRADLYRSLGFGKKQLTIWQRAAAD